MSRLSQSFVSLKAAGRRAVVPYVVAGDPSRDSTVGLLHSLVRAGADVLEIGVPFSDPMSEGPVIQQGHERALENGVSLRDVLEWVRQFREDDDRTPVVVMGYANPIERMGYPAFADACASVGVDGVITVDLPPEEVDVLNDELKRVAIDNIFLISPTTPDERISTITASASGFIYYVALKGVTGAGNLDIADVTAHLERIRAVSTLPVCVGFGIRDAESAASVAGVADGVVVGSALIDVMAKAAAAGSDEAESIAAGIGLLTEIRAGVDGPGSAG